ncbi:hypothetical protein BGZ76_009987 [Entomortierella beljakovae]|nr:hypothetical protein BGZ76_009987 [Entomortierella beljakovae]
MATKAHELATKDEHYDNFNNSHRKHVLKVITDNVIKVLAAEPPAGDSCACHGDNIYQHETDLKASLRFAYGMVNDLILSGTYADTCSDDCTHSIGLTPWRLWMMLNNGQLTEGGSMPEMPEKYYDCVAEQHLQQWFGERRICLIAIAGLERNKWALRLSNPECQVCGLRRAILDCAPNAWTASDVELEATNHASVHEAFMDVLSAGSHDLKITDMCDACWLFSCKRSMMRPGMMPTAGTFMEALAAMVPPAVKQVRSQAITFAEGAKQLAEFSDAVRFFDHEKHEVVTLSTLMRVSGLSAYDWFYANTYHSVFVSHTWGRYWCKNLDRQYGVDVPHVCNKMPGNQHAVVTNVDTILQSTYDIGRRYVWLDWLCVDQDETSPQKALMVRLQAALFRVVQFMVVYAHDPETITSFQLLHDDIIKTSANMVSVNAVSVDTASVNTCLKQVADGNWFTSLWTLQELALHKKFMGVLSQRRLIVPPFDIHAAAKDLVYLGSEDLERAHWVCNENLLRTGLAVCVSDTSSVYERAASYRVCEHDDRRSAYAAGLARLPGYDYGDTVGDSAGILASGWITELISAKAALSEASSTGGFVRSSKAHSLMYRVQSWHTWMAGINAERVCVIGRTCSGSHMRGDKPRIKLRAFQNVHGWQHARDDVVSLFSLSPILFLASIGGSKDEPDGMTMLCLVLNGLDGHQAFGWRAIIATVWEAPLGVVRYYELGAMGKEHGEVDMSCPIQ